MLTKVPELVLKDTRQDGLVACAGCALRQGALEPGFLCGDAALQHILLLHLQRCSLLKQ